MNNWGRTKNNKKRLKLKSFFKRLILIVVIPSKSNCFYKPLPINPGSSSGGRRSSDRGAFYILEEIKPSSYKYAIKKTIGKHFNKCQLIGKILLMGKIQYRIIS